MEDSQVAVEMLRAVGNDIAHIDDLNGRIVTTTREQTSANLEIVGRLQSVQSIAQNTADDVETLARSSERLPRLRCGWMRWGDGFIHDFSAAQPSAMTSRTKSS